MEHENWILKSSSYMLLYESHFKCKGTYRLKIKVREKIYQATKNQNRAVMDILISDKAEFIIKYMPRIRRFIRRSSIFMIACAVLSRSVMSDSVTPWTVACQAPLSMGILQARILE